MDVLLGKPYQQELSAETGIGIALVGLEDLKTTTAKVTSLVADLLNDCAMASNAGNSLEEQLEEISRQLTVIRQQCSLNDRALCYTLQYSGFDVSLSIDNTSRAATLSCFEY
ncbi:hypothetical protein NQ317_019491 [Molorchus minor]|uniref:Uncharacterized protein n=1 Tax=Molorchus minor TaxID=1323400 RepID=A0ABQ9JNN6_9CUCU|nr:hypothetical protein NQ317_019491 [Molorchus minor]